MKRLIFVGIVAAGLAFAPSAEAAVIDFATAGTGFTGTILSSGGVITSGSGIALGDMNISGLPSLNGAYDTLGTGANSLLDAVRTVLNGSAVLSFNVAAMTFQIDGGIGCLEASTSTVPCTSVASVTPLVSGSLLSFTATANQVNFTGGNIVLAAAFKTFFGITTVPPAWVVNSAFVINNAGQSISTDVNLTSVPEPGTMILLGTGLLGLAAVARRRLRKV